MQALTNDPDSDQRQKPFKVFLTLLDKWEIGGSLSERLAVPALQAIKLAAEAKGDSRNHAEVNPAEMDIREMKLTVIAQIIMTASAVYEAIEPIILWRTFFRTIESLPAGGSDDVQASAVGLSVVSSALWY
jgi:hypothetical protein